MGGFVRGDPFHYFFLAARFTIYMFIYYLIASRTKLSETPRRVTKTRVGAIRNHIGAYSYPSEHAFCTCCILGPNTTTTTSFCWSG